MGDSMMTALDRIRHVQEVVKGIIALQFDVSVADVERAIHFEEDLSADSLDMIEIQMEVEDTFEIAVDGGNPACLETAKISDFIALVVKAVEAR